MAFGGGFQGFGGASNNNTTSTPAFGSGFGNTSNPGFGGSTSSAFGQSNPQPGSSIFGGGAPANNTGSAFGGGFGQSNASTGFGAPKPAFGAQPNATTTGGSVFGAAAPTTTNNAFGGGTSGFGNTANAGSAFGGSSASTGLFGQNKPTTGFGASPGAGLFGGGGNAGAAPAFGGGNTGATPAFGGGNTGTAFGASSQPTNQGTAVTPFSPFIEKDGTSAANSHYQSITFMQNYQPFSFEELRLADYTAGRRYGNSNGQAGAFGQNTGFGGFGGNTSATQTPAFGATANNNAGSGLFGAQNTNNNNASPFGTSATPNNAFGGGGSASNTGLFGQKPATGGLFGASTTAPASAGGGLFGSSANNTATGTGGTFGGGFGQQNNQSQGATGGLFGGNAANNTQSKPAFGGFGNSPASNTGFGGNTGGFGQQNATNTTSGSSGLFGNAPANTANPFGANQQNNTSANTGGGLFGGGGGGAFGNQNQQQNQTGTGGGLFGGNNFGNNANAQQKPSLFGGAPATGTTGGGLFGQQPQQNNNQGGLFGGANNNQAPQQSLFGAPKPATAPTGLFGGANNTGNTGGGLFGGMNNNQGQQNNGSNAFGQSSQQQQKPTGLFGQSNSANNGTSLFGGLGNNQNQQQNAGSSSLFGNSQNQNQAQNNQFGNSQPSLSATLLTNPYGNEQLFANLGSPSPSVGPLATPLSGAQKPAKRPVALPQFKINPSASLRLITPQKRSNGYGFSYATYGTPGSAQSFTSNGLGSSLLQSGGLSRSLGKSFSTSNLRNGLGNSDSVLAPGAFTPNNRSYHGGSIRRLKVDKALRTSSLFGDNSAEEHPPKRVSFEPADRVNGLANGTPAETSPNNALVRTETDGPEPTPEELGLLRAGRSSTNGTMTNGSSPELDMVPEDGPAPSSQSNVAFSRDVPRSTVDQEVGEYWMSPSLDELRKMSREQLKKVHPFTVGRVGVGKIDFDEVDLTTVPLDEIMGPIVNLELRKATVYANEGVTPPMGKGLNVPSVITLENSWPRAHGGRLPVHERKGARFEKHIARLQRIANTEFIDYNTDTGVWVFRVPHFTTYGLDDDDEEDDTEYGSSLMSSTSSQNPTPTPKGNIPAAVQEMSQTFPEDASVTSDEDYSESNPDDTFDFKKGPSKFMPGSFGAQPIQNDDEMADDNDAQDQEEDSSLLDQRGTSMLDDPFRSSGDSNTPPVQAVDIPMEEEMSGQDMAGSFPRPGAPALYSNDFGVSFGGSLMPKSILKASTMFNGTPKKDLTLAGDWAEQLQRTASPKKQDRQALRERQGVMGVAPVDIAPPKLAASVAGKNFSTTLDIMNSLWAPSASVAGNAFKSSTAGGKGFEWPYQKRPRTDDAFANMSENDQAFHTSVKPHWTTDGTFVYGIAGNASAVSGNMVTSKKAVVSESKDIRFAKFSFPEDTLTKSLQLQLEHTPVSSDAFAQPSADISFAALADSITHPNTPEARHERAVWKLASILFDPVDISCTNLVKGVPTEQIPELESRIRRDALSVFWTDLVKDNAAQHAKDAATAEERAVAFLTGNNIEEACASLLEGRDFRLATIVAQLPGDAKMMEMMTKQIESWTSQNMLSEMTEPVRALYELVAGNVCVSEGKTGATEDRASSFGISTRFGLDWRRSFGLRLWFTGEKQSLADAVQLYADDVVSGRENVRPVPYFTEQSLSPSWNDVDAQTREDTLFGLLKLYSRKPSSDANEVRSLVNNLLAPTSVSGSPLNARLSWQMATLLRSKGILSMTDITDATMDELSLAFSSQLEAANELIFALNVLLHLTGASTRERSIRDLLYRRASALYDPNDSEALPAVLTQDFALPESWLWHARALYARGMQDNHIAEVTYLLRAGDASQAHTVLCRSVGPAAIIERNYDALRELLGAFHDLTTDTSLEGWRVGGKVYFDFIHLLDLVKRDDDNARANKKEILTRLSTALPGVLEGRTGKVGLEERVAVGEMAGLVKAELEKLGREEKGVDRAVLNRLPTAGDTYAKQGVDLSRAYYRAVVA